jgi:hypothetical protein
VEGEVTNMGGTIVMLMVGVPVLTGYLSWRHRKTHPNFSLLGWIFTGLWLTGLALVVWFVIYLITNPWGY